MFSSAWIIVTVLLGAVAGVQNMGARLSKMANRTTCEQFERGAKFGPYMILNTMWKIFYFWSNNTELYPVYFSIPTKKTILKFKEVFETINGDLEIEWEKAALIMEPRPGVEIMLLYAGTPGAFRALIKQERRTKVRPHPTPLTAFADVRMKLVDRWMGIMCCEDLTAFGLARVDELPSTEEACAAAATKLGLRPEDGRSYLYFLQKYKEQQEEL